VPVSKLSKSSKVLNGQPDMIFPYV